MSLQYLARSHETIAALATPPGNGGIAIVRISGPQALSLAQGILRTPLHSIQSHTAKLVTLISKEGMPIDRALFLTFMAPRSFTGEDTAEFHCHGGHLLAQKVLDALIAKGVRIAQPGEFTYRAFINGKIDLTQAEAIQDLISAQNERALEVAEAQLEGKLFSQISFMQKEASQLAALFEAWVDFPEEDLEFESIDQVLIKLQSLAQQMKNLIETFHEGKIIHDGVALCLFGAPNVGKSSLMNALLGKDRAIVSHIPGTTRDVVEDNLRIDGLHCRLIDTAGIRQTTEIIEEEGVRRSKKAMQTADIIFIIFDASQPIDTQAIALVNEAKNQPTCLVWNKIDLCKDTTRLPILPVQETVFVSAKTGQGLDTLKQAVHRLLFSGKSLPRDAAMITNIRHKEALTNAHAFLCKVIEGLQQGTSPEFITFDMRQALSSLGSIIGTDITEDILTEIFAKFCIGK